MQRSQGPLSPRRPVYVNWQTRARSSSSEPLPGDHECVALVDRMDIEKRDRVASLRHKACFLTVLEDAAKDAGGLFGHVASSLIAFASACAPSAASSMDANSRGVCEPPVERTKIIPVGTPESAGFCGSRPRRAGCA